MLDKQQVVKKSEANPLISSRNIGFITVNHLNHQTLLAISGEGGPAVLFDTNGRSSVQKTGAKKGGFPVMESGDSVQLVDWFCGDFVFTFFQFLFFRF